MKACNPAKDIETKADFEEITKALPPATQADHTINVVAKVGKRSAGMPGVRFVAGKLIWSGRPV
jgi:hypothetical protein